MTPRFARVLLFLIAFGIYFADRVTKLLAIKILYQGQSVKVLPGIFNITLIFNNGAAFGLLQNRAAIFIIVSILAILAIIVYAWKDKALKTIHAVPLGLILGGAIGNLVDRISYGYVIDFLDFRVWPVFNLADSAITVGVGLLILSTLLKFRR